MKRWSLLIVGAVLLPLQFATAGSQKMESASRPAPRSETRLVSAATTYYVVQTAGFTQRTTGCIKQTSYSCDPCAAPAADCCAPAACAPLNGCAAPANECAAPANACAAPANACAAPANACCAPEACAPSCGTAAGCAAPAQSYANGCCYSNGCGNGHCGNGHCGCGYCCCEEESCCERLFGCNCCKWLRFHTTGDMYPHFAYRPAYHGYYYFRPYNYTVLTGMGTASHYDPAADHRHLPYHMDGAWRALGWTPSNPYMVSMFDAIYEDFEQSNPDVVLPPAGTMQPLGDQLPNLEDLLN